MDGYVQQVGCNSRPEAVEALLAVLEDDLLTLALLAVQWLHADSLNILPQHLCRRTASSRVAAADTATIKTRRCCP